MAALWLTAPYPFADRPRVIEVLNDVLATEMVCVLRYKSHYFMARGINSEAVKEEFLQHSNDEQQHTDWVAERIAIESYSELTRWLGNDDPTSRKLMEDILKAEEEHADDMVNLLTRVAHSEEWPDRREHYYVFANPDLIYTRPARTAGAIHWDGRWGRSVIEQNDARRLLVPPVGRAAGR
jgi:bacterioferritin